MKILYVTTISLTMNSFFQPHIKLLVENGHRVDIACNYSDLPLADTYHSLKCTMHQIDFSRSPLSKENIKAYFQLQEVMKNGNYDVVHCHTPNASIITRLVCQKYRKKNKLKVFYTAHGFHFYKGAPKKNWLMYYPVEKLCARFTDKLLTMNQEDYAIAKAKFHTNVLYIPGVGIDLSKFESAGFCKAKKRRELGIPDNAFVLINVGELSTRKNQSVLIRALAELNRSDAYLLIAGRGSMLDTLKAEASKLGVLDRVIFLGYRTDIRELMMASDVFVFSSLHEGLPVALMEAMACCLPCVASNIRGNVDLIDQSGGALFEPYDYKACADAIQKLDNFEQKGLYNRKKLSAFSLESVLSEIPKIYG